MAYLYKDNEDSETPCFNLLKNHTLNQLSTPQIDSLKKTLYDTLISADKNYSLGEMGDCRNYANVIVKAWIEKENIITNDSDIVNKVTETVIDFLKENIYQYLMENDDETSLGGANNCHDATEGVIQQWTEKENIEIIP